MPRRSVPSVRGTALRTSVAPGSTGPGRLLCPAEQRPDHARAGLGCHESAVHAVASHTHMARPVASGPSRRGNWLTWPTARVVGLALVLSALTACGDGLLAQPGAAAIRAELVPGADVEAVSEDYIGGEDGPDNGVTGGLFTDGTFIFIQSVTRPPEHKSVPSR